MKYQKISSNSSWAPRFHIIPDVIIFETNVIIFCNKFITRFITSRYSIPRNSDRVKMQEISMGDSSGPPRHPKPSVDAWFCLLSSFWSDFGAIWSCEARFRSGITPKSKPANFWSWKIQSRASHLYEASKIMEIGPIAKKLQPFSCPAV